MEGGGFHPPPAEIGLSKIGWGSFSLNLVKGFKTNLKEFQRNPITGFQEKYSEATLNYSFFSLISIIHKRTFEQI